MLKVQTEEKLKKMNMRTMVEAAHSMEGMTSQLSKEEWLEIMVDRLYDERMTKKLNNLIKSAHLPCPDACIEELIVDSDRGLDVGLIDRIATCGYVTKGFNVVILGASGAGKSWLMSAFCISACRNYLRVEYISAQDMVDELAALRMDPHSHSKRIKELTNRDVLAIDDFVLKEDPEPGEIDEIYSVINARTRAKKPTMIASQFLMDGWVARMGGYPEAESVVDRIKNHCFKIVLKGDISMRERCMDEELKAYASK